MQRIYENIHRLFLVSLMVAVLGISSLAFAQDEPQPLWIATYEGTLRGANWSPDGTALLTWADWQDQEKPARLWSAEDGTELWTRTELINGAQWKSDSASVLTWGGVKAEVWDRETGEALLTIEPGMRLISAGWSPDETLIYTHSFDGVNNLVQVWSDDDGSEVLKLEFNAIVKTVAWHPNSEQIVTSLGPENYLIQVWNVADGAELQTIEHTEYVYDVRWNADTSQLLGRTEHGTILGWATEDGEPTLFIENNEQILDFIWNPEGTQALLSYMVEDARMVSLWNLTEEEKTFELSAIPTRNQPFWMDDVPYWVMTTPEMTTADIFSLEAEKSLITSFTPSAGILGASWNPDHSRLLTWTDDSHLQVWDTSDLPVAE